MQSMPFALPLREQAARWFEEGRPAALVTVGAFKGSVPRETGTRNDLLQLRVPAPLAYENIHAPTLLVHGSAEAASPWADVHEITTKLPAARVLTVEGAGSIVWLGVGARAMQQAVIDFLKSPPPLPSPTPTSTPNPAPATSPTPTP